MSIDATHSVTNQATARFQQMRSDFQSLQSDLQSGNIANAQADFASLLKDAPPLQNLLKSDADSVQSSALSALSTSLKSGDVTGAQTALASLGQTLGGAHCHHHHHHHHGSSVSPSSATGSGFTPLDLQAIRTDFQTLACDLQSGDLTGAQKAWVQLQKDDPRLSNGANPISPPGTAAA
jgi:hypothetical protein